MHGLSAENNSTVTTVGCGTGQHCDWTPLAPGWCVETATPYCPGCSTSVSEQPQPLVGWGGAGHGGGGHCHTLQTLHPPLCPPDGASQMCPGLQEYDAWFCPCLQPFVCTNASTCALPSLLEGFIILYGDGGTGGPGPQVLAPEAGHANLGCAGQCRAQPKCEAWN